MQHLCFFLYHKSNPFMIPHAARQRFFFLQIQKPQFRQNPSQKADEAAVFRVLRENRLHFSAKSFHVSHFLCEMLKFCRLFLLILFGIS